MELSGTRVAVLVEENYEDLELWYPLLRLREAGAEVKTVGPAAGQEYKSKHGYPAKADLGMEKANAADFDALVIPGGYAPDRMRRHAAMLGLVRAMHEAGKPVAFICHAGWVPISAGIVRGRTVTSFSAIRDDLINAGAQWVDQEVVVDGNLISSRSPADLPAFCRELVRMLTRVRVG
ncbi:MAG: type 1 glutamine amidotransferase domain-containing protein [Armatimonadota bacterium]|nr:type 1 glutamine amidotransferase domain-containing protein [Armatimonadota bacterium]MDR7464802.1 type 1 glutamine amidotransferase domain-containing protein [Armatimonadota bacterium]MDR7470121.1 type 1 glutamine amidotransferase domain-containing protein [Armatimonadota bacterium]MDR7475730.1 type 1 glutamine amidotransferase domain-containing protein [Armatimonadota bacterium]MDR7537916.1 type 1 glutamine amidotransferase domain-containing protein [Armatimonadota bacterium]